MTKNQNILFKIIILLFGLGIIGLAYFLFAGDGNLSAEQKFVWVNVCVLYAVFFIPFFFTSFGKGKNDASNIISWAVISSFLSVVEGVIILMTVLVALEKAGIKLAVLLEAIVLFLGVIGLYLSMMTGSHIQAVDQKYEAKLSQVMAIRSSMDMLTLKAGSLNENFGFEKKKLNSIGETIRFMAPNDSPVAVAQEEKIITKISEIDYEIDVVLSGGDSSNLKQHVAMLEMLINQRKLVRS